MVALDWLGRLVAFLGGAGPVLFGIALLVATPFLDRLLVRRKRLGFRVLSSKARILTPSSSRSPGRSGTKV
ncbi:hypothetical protein, partial [Sphaerisporangium album]|uniref:hypothetical protein n=1 Tax=Sphaerisporangium album TaxID=509200 RepID=UPI001C68C3B3